MRATFLRAMLNIYDSFSQYTQNNVSQQSNIYVIDYLLPCYSMCRKSCVYF